MARWRLLNDHYLKVAGTEYEHREQDMATGENNIMRIPVPRYLSPQDPKHCRSSGDCVVCHKGKGLPGDWVFEGPPTPDMVPLDEEAQAITDKWQPLWSHPVESLPAQGQSYLPPDRNVSQTDPAFKSMQDQIAALMEANAKLAEQVKGLADKPAARRA